MSNIRTAGAGSGGAQIARSGVEAGGVCVEGGGIGGFSKRIRIIKFVERSKEWTSVEASSASAENLMMGVADEELYNLPTAEYVHRRGGFLNRQLTVYHVAFHACVDLGNVEVLLCISNILA
ncbi:hypothetical protein FEM48_Zijuj07G0085200 [Ziziphus jujuba var. spinosa]|uniref:Uncharacterized protein n=1 Tax=Ziziphus jujuba var. spinosa TaxID=714518 RepID=A0A978V3K5_ZIZJJ|nr:hypothetical protein FEM48_Zijuj07G0085200 [Ziziphus jujuba var. spinosa]